MSFDLLVQWIEQYQTKPLIRYANKHILDFMIISFPNTNSKIKPGLQIVRQNNFNEIL